MPKTIGGNDTVDNATHLLHRLQADGWGVRNVSVEFDYAALDGKASRLLVGATVHVELIPTRG